MIRAAAPIAFLVPLMFAGNTAPRPVPSVVVDREDLVGVTGDWRFAAERRETFRTDWCARQGYDRTICGVLPPRTPSTARELAADRRAYCLTERGTRNRVFCARIFRELDARFDSAWRTVREAELSRFPQLDLDNRDLRNASAEGSKFINARMEGVRLDGARLRNAEFEGAALRASHLEASSAFYADFSRADLTLANLRFSDLTSANFEQASLPGADLRGARLVDAALVSTSLRDADLTAADLTNARFGLSDLAGAILDGAILDGADLSEARGLEQRQLETAVGDETTVLPQSPSGFTAFTIWSCWKELPQAVSAALDSLPPGYDAVSKRFEDRRCDRTEEPVRLPADRFRSPPVILGPDLAAYRLRYRETRQAEREQIIEARAGSGTAAPAPSYTARPPLSRSASQFASAAAPLPRPATSRVTVSTRAP